MSNFIPSFSSQPSTQEEVVQVLTAASAVISGTVFLLALIIAF